MRIHGSIHSMKGTDEQRKDEKASAMSSTAKQQTTKMKNREE